MPRNLELRIDDTWKPVSISDISLPEGYSGALFALQKENARCTLAYLRMPGRSLDIREGERAFMVNNEYTRDQYIGYVNNNVLTISYPRSFLGGNHDWPMGNDDDINYSNAFVMYSSQKEVALDPTCVKEVEIVMGQLRGRYEIATLDTSSNGILYIVSE